MPYGTRWRNWRTVRLIALYVVQLLDIATNFCHQLMHASMNVEASNQYKPLQDAESKLVVRDILKNLEDHKGHIAHLRR